MNDYPYPVLTSQLHYACTPLKYRFIARRTSYKGRTRNIFDRMYANSLPEYIYARCPICQTACLDKVDIYQIGPGYIGFNLNSSTPLPQDYPTSANTPCQHYLGTHAFKNLHGQLPVEVSTFKNPSGEIPYITPWFLPDDIESYCVIFAIPICRIEKRRFQPTYTLFVLTYFSENPRLLLDRHYANEFRICEEDSGYYPITVCSPSAENNGVTAKVLQNLATEDALDDGKDLGIQLRFNLSYWAQVGKLGYMDMTDASHPLKIGKRLNLPDYYRNIQGKLRPYKWHNKKFTWF